MRKIIATVIMISISIFIYGQQGVSITKSQVSYDTNFNPKVQVTISNNTNKGITNVVLSFSFTLANKDMYQEINKNALNTKYVTINKEVNVYPHSSATATVTLSKLDDGFNYAGCFIEKVRFSDGTIK